MKTSRLFALCIPLFLAIGGHAYAGAGPTARVGDYYELNQSIDCNQFFSCTLNFTTGAPSDKYFRVREINCLIRTNRVVDDVRLYTTPANSNVGGARARWLLPGRYEYSGGKYYSNINEQIDFIIGPTSRPAVTVSTGGQDTFTIACSLTGNLQ